MDLNTKNILIVSPESWNHLFVSKHHYAVHLAERGNKVFFLNPPSGELSINETANKNLKIVSYKGFPKGMRHYPSFLQRMFTRRVYSTIQSLCKVEFDIVWSFDNSVFFRLDALPSQIYKISHIVDLNQDFQTQLAAATANVCLGNTSYIIGRLKTYNVNTHFVHHGFARSKEKRNVKFPGKNRVKALYSGNFDLMYLDKEIFKVTIERNQDVDFCIAGSWTGDKTWLFQYDNFYYLGILDKIDLSSYLEVADILLVFYKYDDYPQQLANPHKLMEYLGAGKVVVASWTDQYKELFDLGLIAMARNRDSLPFIFKKVKENLVGWNSPEKCKARIAYAEDNTYQKQIERIEKVMNS